MKRMFALTIIVVLFISITNAADKIEKNYSDVGDSSGYTTEVATLTDIGIIQGDDNSNFRPEDEITRAEFATVLIRAMGDMFVEQAQTEELINKNWYKDVPPTHWAAGYINLATTYGAISGFGDGTFHPEESVTNEQVIKMLVAAWGYKDEAEQLGGYPNGYMEIAKKFGVTDTVLFNYGNASKRWVVSMFVYGVLEKLPISDNALMKPNPPVIPSGTETSSAERDPMPENTNYVSDPISVLKKVTRDSVSYERTTFEQQVPEQEFPFIIRDDAIFSTDNIGEYLVTIPKPDEKGNLIEGTASLDKGVLLADLPVGTWKTVIYINSGAIQDSFFIDIKRDEKSVYFSGLAHRYTTLRIKPIETAENFLVEISNEKTDEHFPFQIKTVTNEGGKTILYADYTSPVGENQFLDFSIVSYNGIVFSMSNPITGYVQRITPFIVENLVADIEYVLQISINEKSGGGTSFKGVLILKNDGDFVLKGDVRVLKISGYEIDDAQ